MRILLVNDDGFDAIGIQYLRSLLAKQHDILTIAPMHNNSWKAFSKSEQFAYEMVDVMSYKVNGTPVDAATTAVYLAQTLQFVPDVVISGINNGENVAFDVLYSGTLAACQELKNHFQCRSLSLSNSDFKQLNLDQFGSAINQILQWVVKQPNYDDYFYNICLPKHFNGQYIVCQQSSQVYAYFEIHMEQNSFCQKMKITQEKLQESSHLQDGKIVITILKL